MRPEKTEKRDSAEAFAAVGVPAEWYEPLQKTGVLTVAALGRVAPNKLHQDLCGYNKKNKLGLSNPAIDTVKAWVEAAAGTEE